MSRPRLKCLCTIAALPASMRTPGTSNTLRSPSCRNSRRTRESPLIVTRMSRNVLRWSFLNRQQSIFMRTIFSSSFCISSRGVMFFALMRLVPSSVLSSAPVTTTGLSLLIRRRFFE